MCRYFSHQPDKGIWVGDFYGSQGPLEFDEGYVGVRRRSEKLRGWRVASLGSK